jgi:hypothetical protein
VRRQRGQLFLEVDDDEYAQALLETGLLGGGTRVIGGRGRCACPPDRVPTGSPSIALIASALVASALNASALNASDLMTIALIATVQE